MLLKLLRSYDSIFLSRLADPSHPYLEVHLKHPAGVNVLRYTAYSKNYLLKSFGSCLEADVGQLKMGV